MDEVELKILEIVPDDEIKKLEKLGFKKTWSGIVTEKFFDMPDKSLNKNHKVLRLRKAYDVVELTIKEKMLNHPFLKIRDEKEILVNSFDSAIELLESLGFLCMATREKHRSSFKLDDIKVEIDLYPNAKPYMEIEASEDKVLSCLKKLNHPLERTTNKSASKVLKLYNLDPREVLFD